MSFYILTKALPISNVSWVLGSIKNSLDLLNICFCLYSHLLTLFTVLAI